MAKPFADMALSRGYDPAPILEKSGIDPVSIGEADAYIPIQAWYDFAEAVSSVLDDPCTGFSIGYSSENNRLPNVKAVDQDSAALGEVFTALIVDTRRILTGNAYQLTVDESFATVRSRRNFCPTSPPRQIDGFFVGFMMRMFREHVTGHWRRWDLTVTVCDPNAIPEEERQRSVFQKGDPIGATFQFPAEWLLMRSGKYSPNAEVGQNRLDTDFMNGLRGVIQSQLNDPGISIETVAKQLALSPRQLQTQLFKLGSNYTQELKNFRRAAACQLLTDGNISVAAVGEAVGIPDPTTFSRAFKSWTSVSPRRYQKEKRSKADS